MVLQALHVPRARRPTRPSKGSKERRLVAKKQQAQRKAQRRKPSADE
jgi:ribosome-associated protein